MSFCQMSWCLHYDCGTEYQSHVCHSSKCRGASIMIMVQSINLMCVIRLNAVVPLLWLWYRVSISCHSAKCRGASIMIMVRFFLVKPHKVIAFQPQSQILHMTYGAPFSTPAAKCHKHFSAIIHTRTLTKRSSFFNSTKGWYTWPLAYFSWPKFILILKSWGWLQVWRTPQIWN
jgi:hypothetical protein